MRRSYGEYVKDRIDDALKHDEPLVIIINKRKHVVLTCGYDYVHVCDKEDNNKEFIINTSRAGFLHFVMDYEEEPPAAETLPMIQEQPETKPMDVEDIWAMAERQRDAQNRRG